MSENDNIDLKNLSQRELLIITHKKVDDIAEALKKISERQAMHEVRISLVEQRVMFWGAVFGGIAGFIATLVTSIIKS